MDIRYQVTVERWRGGLAIRLPHAVVERHRFREGESLVMTRVPAGFLIHKKSRPRLRDLVAKINRRNRVGALAFGAPVGKEVW